MELTRAFKLHASSAELRVTRRAADLLDLPETPVLAHWHGEWRTDGFATTVGELKDKATPQKRRGRFQDRCAMARDDQGDARALLDELNKRSGVPVLRRTDQS